MKTVVGVGGKKWVEMENTLALYIQLLLFLSMPVAYGGKE